MLNNVSFADCCFSKSKIVKIITFMMIVSSTVYGQNPLVRNLYIADPTARVFNGKVYVYPSHDIKCEPGFGSHGFCMKDYHVFSSENLVDWEDHGVILSHNDVSWVDTNAFTMWAPDCIFKNGLYYFYFPASEKGKERFKSRTIGVAVSKNPYGPFVPSESSIEGVSGIDPNVFIDTNGEAYLYWAARSNVVVARLSETMTQITTEPQVIENLPQGFKEGPFVFERSGIYYMTFPHVADSTERLAYAMGKSPLGPFEFKGVIMPELESECWTNHHSIIEYNSQWYLFYHDNLLSPGNDKLRSIMADSLFFNADGTIKTVLPSKRGIGVTDAYSKIQVDRYSTCSNSGVDIAFLNTDSVMNGWSVSLQKNAWIRYNTVDFGNKKLNKVVVKYKTNTDATIKISVKDTKGESEASVECMKKSDWNYTESDIKISNKGIQDIIISLETGDNIDIDWIRFK